MTLACPMYEVSPEFHLVEAILWSVALMLPVMTFLFLPKLLPLRRELWWMKARVLVPLAWLASRIGGDGVGARSWLVRSREAWLADVQRHHPPMSGKLGLVAADATLMQRATWAGRGAAWITMALGGLALFTVATAAASGYRVGVALGVIVATAIAAWAARVAGSGAAFAAQAVAIGRPPGARVILGALIGVAYGAVGGFTASLVAMAASVPVAGAITGDFPSSRDMMVVLSAGGGFAAFFGATVGAILIGSLAGLVRRPSTPGA